MSSPATTAVLQAGDTETLYRRAGDGAPVLLICSGALADPAGGAIFERLATRFRVVAAAIPPGAAGGELLTTWLCELVEGLGLERPHVIVDHALAADLIDGVFGGTDTFSRVLAAVAPADPAPAALRARGVAIIPVDAAAPATAAAAMMAALAAG